jgi:ribA/ribD-fused uncharacterized protein
MIWVEDELYPSAEHAFQAMKTLNSAERRSIALAATPGQAKKAGRALSLREDWERVKDEQMLKILRVKFAVAPLAEKLLETGDQELVEGNWWGDTYWGVCKGTGQNKLGKSLMTVRAELKG